MKNILILLVLTLFSCKAKRSEVETKLPFEENTLSIDTLDNYPLFDFTKEISSDDLEYMLTYLSKNEPDASLSEYLIQPPALYIYRTILDLPQSCKLSYYNAIIVKEENLESTLDKWSYSFKPKRLVMPNHSISERSSQRKIYFSEPLEGLVYCEVTLTHGGMDQDPNKISLKYAGVSYIFDLNSIKSECSVIQGEFL